MNKDNYKLVLPYMDLHVAGEPFRLITKCPFQLDGRTMFENKLIAQEKIDDVRRLLMMKPRGYTGMYGGFLLSPIEEDSDFGVLFMHCDGYSNMCGHGSLAVARALYELYPEVCVAKKDGIRVDVPAGQIQLFCNVENNRLESVSVINRPSFVCGTDVELTVPEIGILHIDIVFAGGYMVYISAEEVSITICPENIPEMLKMADKIMPYIFEKMDFIHPEMQELSLKKCGFCLIFTEPVEKEGDFLVSRNLTVYGSGLFDYSPTGTGTSGRLTLLEAKGLLPRGGIFRNSGISGEAFEARVIEHVKVGEFDAVVPEITGQAYITGRGEMLLEEEDPIKKGIGF